MTLATAKAITGGISGHHNDIIATTNMGC